MSTLPLTHEQELAACHNGGAAYVLAGAGTGKTHTLIARVEHLIATGCDPQAITITTFTRKATAELRQRIARIFGANRPEAALVEVTTIDGLIQRIHRDAVHAGLLEPSQLISPSEQRVLLLELISEIHPPFRQQYSHDIEEDLTKLQRYFDSGISPFPLSTLDKDLVNKVRSQYMKQVTSEHLATYSSRQEDVIGALPALLQNFDSSMRICSHLMVDEFQDTSQRQYEFLKALSPSGSGLWVVGDPCQQIYEWRGASPHNFQNFKFDFSACKYEITGNRRSNQPILDTAHTFLANHLPELVSRGDLMRLHALREHAQSNPVLTGNIEQVFTHIATLHTQGIIKHLGDIAILCNTLTKRNVNDLRKYADAHSIPIEIRTSRTDHVLDAVFDAKYPYAWRPQKAHGGLLGSNQVKSYLRRAITDRDFDSIRRLRSLAESCNDYDSQSTSLDFSEAWPAVSHAKAQEIGVTDAVISRIDAIQVMTIHSAKGLEFPIVVVMTFSDKSFPGKTRAEDSRVGYVGITRARDLLYLAHTKSLDSFHNVIRSFGTSTTPCHAHGKPACTQMLISPNNNEGIPPIIAASHLNYYRECPLKFAAFHEGRFLPKWSKGKSIGTRLHKALEYFLLDGLPTSEQSRKDCFEQGVRDGDSLRRQLDETNIVSMRSGFEKITSNLYQSVCEVVAVEEPFSLVLESGQVEGVADALILTKDNHLTLYEWKSTKSVEGSHRLAAVMQAGTAAEAFQATRHPNIQDIAVVPLFNPDQTQVLPRTSEFNQSVSLQLNDIFTALHDRKYEATPGEACKDCPLTQFCPDSRVS